MPGRKPVSNIHLYDKAPAVPGNVANPLAGERIHRSGSRAQSCRQGTTEGTGRVDTLETSDEGRPVAGWREARLRVLVQCRATSAVETGFSRQSSGLSQAGQ